MTDQVDRVKYPLGIQSFSKIREGGYLYLDKTKLLYEIIHLDYTYFLSRPRRFGKSLLVSTLKALFEGKKELFQGLWIANSSYDWRVHPVIHLDFSRLLSNSLEQLKETLNALLDEVAFEYNINLTDSPFPSFKFANLINELSKESPVVILIDEYDRPFVSHLAEPDTVKQNRNFLRDFFVQIKAFGEKVKLSLITGVTKFTQVSLFSDLNNIFDISLESKYSGLLGVTEDEIYTNMSSEVERVSSDRKMSKDDLLAQIKDWYNGYRFSTDKRDPTVYSPLSLMTFLNNGKLSNYWFSTATPSFAIDLIKQGKLPVQKLEEGIVVGKEIEMTYDPDRIDLPTLLFQTGYLTIDSFDEKSQTYRLKYPNKEVRNSFLNHLLYAFYEVSPSEMQGMLTNLKHFIEISNYDDFFLLFNQLLSSVPYHIHIACEAYYHSLIYLIIRSLGFRVRAELSTHQGRIDMSLETESSIVIFEFKIDKSADEALEQIEDREYFNQYLSDSRILLIVGVNFDSKSRSINDWKVQEIGKNC